MLEKTQCLPLHRYTEFDERISNITEWGLGQLREYYGDDGITAEDIFAYTYAKLHDQAFSRNLRVGPATGNSRGSLFTPVSANGRTDGPGSA